MFRFFNEDLLIFLNNMFRPSFLLSRYHPSHVLLLVLLSGHLMFHQMFAILKWQS